MTELYFLRHAERIDHALKQNPEAKPIIPDYQPYDPSLAESGIDQIKTVVDDICSTTNTFQDKENSLRKNVFIHFSPYLRCCQTADILITELKSKFSELFPNYKVRFQLLGDFALSEWVHDKMENKPPFIDSNDAYNMYTPNLKTLKNKNACSNFRPTISLGQYNGPDLSYTDYQARSKEYFQKLLATYDKPSYIKNQDIIIIVSHGYMINNFMSYFINHPIFEEIPSATINFAKRIEKDEIEDIEDEYDPKNFYWKMEQDALNITKEEGVDTVLNLESDIVYYKTNFIKKNELLNKPKEEHIKDEYKPRASFKIESTSASKSADGKPPIRNNYLCPAAKDWVPNKRHFNIKAEFKEKVMNDESFRRNFDITHPPSKQISPDVSPNSAPTRSNSVIDLSKILSNESVQPIKLKYSNTSEIPIHKINSRVNSQVNLAQFNRSANSSAENSTTDLPKYVSQLQNRHRSSSNPNSSVYVAHHTKDSYFPQVINRVRSNESDMSIDSIGDGVVDEMDIIKENEPSSLSMSIAAAASASASASVSAAAAASAIPTTRASPMDTLNRARSLNKKRPNNPLFSSTFQQKRSQNQLPTFGKLISNSNHSNDVSESSDESESDHEPGEDISDNNSNHRSSKENISLAFKSNNHHHNNHKANHNYSPGREISGSNSPESVSPPRAKHNRSRKNSIQFYSTLSNGQNGSSATSHQSQQQQQHQKPRPIFYNFDTDGDDDDDDESGSDDSMSDGYSSSSNFKTKKKDKDDYFWFGQNK
ncbi:uncharacterized protein KGF55_004923 [Candida pseudojiufengensis]|uniref:uncharacterized protein n=1 Tax=Candida pseudojiufengensis TaxID=497109 RepID=UPI002224C63D|nr:uncharacterized protein KGF55_004923 [Candida pseudojiufengensis]KAI5960200.1 hypothetical protein KGF55_004923 [Candida pseudojiufengensis]